MKARKTALIVLQLVLLLNAIGGAFYGLSGAEGVDPSWLAGTPFKSYIIPSLILLVAVGGSMVLATAAWLLRLRIAPRLSVLAGSVLVVWIIVQVAIIGYVSWMQPTCFIAGLIIAALGAWATVTESRVRACAETAKA